RQAGPCPPPKPPTGPTPPSSACPSLLVWLGHERFRFPLRRARYIEGGLAQSARRRQHIVVLGFDPDPVRTFQYLHADDRGYAAVRQPNRQLTPREGGALGAPAPETGGGAVPKQRARDDIGGRIRDERLHAQAGSPLLHLHRPHLYIDRARVRQRLP